MPQLPTRGPSGPPSAPTKKGFFGFFRHRALRFGRELVVVGHAVLHPHSPAHLRLGGVLLFIYLLSPVDLVPFVVPILGVVDDFLIVPWGLARVVERLPPSVRRDVDAAADRTLGRWVRRPLLFLASLLLFLIVVWVGLLWLLWRWGPGWWGGG
ncbi:MAG: DUF1232 domain-containing protein [Gemmatimonadota bacterium]